MLRREFLKLSAVVPFTGLVKSSKIPEFPEDWRRYPWLQCSDPKNGLGETPNKLYIGMQCIGDSLDIEILDHRLARYYFDGFSSKGLYGKDCGNVTKGYLATTPQTEFLVNSNYGKLYVPILVSRSLIFILIYSNIRECKIIAKSGYLELLG